VGSRVFGNADPVSRVNLEKTVELFLMREGWRAQFFGGIAPGVVARFRLVALWIENRVLVRLRSTGTGLTEAKVKRAAA